MADDERSEVTQWHQQHLAALEVALPLERFQALLAKRAGKSA